MREKKWTEVYNCSFAYTSKIVETQSCLKIGSFLIVISHC